MRVYKIIFWISSLTVAFFHGLLPALFFNTKEYLDTAERLGYPAYIVPIMAIFKLIGGAVLILPVRSRLVHEWAYAGFTISFALEFISYYIVDGFGAECIHSLLFLVVLTVSYVALVNMRIERRKRKLEAILEKEEVKQHIET